MTTISKYHLQFFLLLILCLSSCKEETQRLSNYAVHGLDVSHYQGQIDWETVLDKKIDFVFIKATESDSYVDSLFLKNWEALKNTSALRGAYHFFRPQVNPKKQFDHFKKIVQLDSTDLPPVLDIEVLDKVSKEKIQSSLKIWLELATIQYGKKPIIYTNQKYWNTYLDTKYFRTYPLWIARYNHQKPILNNQKKWIFWQYGNRGKLEGINGFVDFNVFNGSKNELKAFCSSN